MPAIGFICPDKEKVTFQECFTECRLKADLPCGRCKALPFLRKVSLQREWTGEPSTTQLIGGTREAWLKMARSIGESISIPLELLKQYMLELRRASADITKIS